MIAQFSREWNLIRCYLKQKIKTIVNRGNLTFKNKNKTIKTVLEKKNETQKSYINNMNEMKMNLIGI